MQTLPDLVSVPVQTHVTHCAMHNKNKAEATYKNPTEFVEGPILGLLPANTSRLYLPKALQTTLELYRKTFGFIWWACFRCKMFNIVKIDLRPES